jgi:hypothetical protein
VPPAFALTFILQQALPIRRSYICVLPLFLRADLYALDAASIASSAPSFPTSQAKAVPISLGLLQKSTVRCLSPTETLPLEDDEAQPARNMQPPNSNRMWNFEILPLHWFYIITPYHFSCRL